jgi:hypothetical protein
MYKITNNHIKMSRISLMYSSKFWMIVKMLINTNKNRSQMKMYSSICFFY